VLGWFLIARSVHRSVQLWKGLVAGRASYLKPLKHKIAPTRKRKKKKRGSNVKHVLKNEVLLEPEPEPEPEPELKLELKCDPDPDPDPEAQKLTDSDESCRVLVSKKVPLQHTTSADADAMEVENALDPADAVRREILAAIDARAREPSTSAETLAATEARVRVDHKNHKSDHKSTAQRQCCMQMER